MGFATELPADTICQPPDTELSPTGDSPGLEKKKKPRKPPKRTKKPPKEPVSSKLLDAFNRLIEADTEFIGFGEFRSKALTMAKTDPMTDAEIDVLLERFDQTGPKLQRRIIAEFICRQERFREQLEKTADDLGMFPQDLSRELLVAHAKHIRQVIDGKADPKYIRRESSND